MEEVNLAHGLEIGTVTSTALEMFIWQVTGSHSNVMMPTSAAFVTELGCLSTHPASHLVTCCSTGTLQCFLGLLISAPQAEVFSQWKIRQMKVEQGDDLLIAAAHFSNPFTAAGRRYSS